jgi:hypothetical protein
MNIITRDKTGEARIWWHTNNFDKQGRLWRHGRLWLHVPGNCFRFEWWPGKRFGIGVTVGDGSFSDEQLSLYLELPLLFALSFGVQRWRWVKRLPGIQWTSVGADGNTVYDHSKGERELSLRCSDGAIRWRLWRHPDHGRGRDWRDRSFYPLDFLLGRQQYSEGPRERHETTITFPEAAYPVAVELYTSTWKRPRWPKVLAVSRADVEMGTPIPIPGKGENSWDMDEDAIWSITCPAATVEEALASLRESVERDRRRYGGEGWLPND